LLLTLILQHKSSYELLFHKTPNYAFYALLDVFVILCCTHITPINSPYAQCYVFFLATINSIKVMFVLILQVKDIYIYISRHVFNENQILFKLASNVFLSKQFVATNMSSSYLLLWFLINICLTLRFKLIIILHLIIQLLLHQQIMVQPLLSCHHPFLPLVILMWIMLQLRLHPTQHPSRSRSRLTLIIW